MAVDFGILERTPTIGSRFMEGQQAAQQQAERNMLRQMQMQQMAIQQENMLAQRENMAAQREERAAHAEERRTKIAQARAAEARLAQFGTAWKQLTGRDELTEADVRQIEGEAFASRDPNAMTLAKGLRADFNTRAENRRVAGLFGPQEMPTGAPTVAPAAPAEAPANALAAPAAMPTAPAAMPTAPAAAAAPPALGARRETVRIGSRDLTEQELLPLLADPNPRVQAAARAALDLMKANKPPTDQAMMTSLGIPLTKEGFAQYNALKQQPAADIQGYTLAKSQGYAGSYEDWVRTKAREGAAQVNVKLPAQETKFEEKLGSGQAERILKDAETAKDAASIIDTVNQGRQIMKQGMITGTGANFLISLNQGLKQIGIDFGFADAAANSQAFVANMANNVGRLIKQFGAGTGLSNEDRNYAEQMAGGRVALDANAINKILDINERAARNVIKQHNKNVKGIKTNIPLEVELPAEPPQIPSQTPPPSRAAPAAAPAPARTLTPQDRQALEWANKNASDPRAAEIKRRLGQ